MRDREGELLGVQVLEYSINMFKLTVMIRITFLQCTRAKIVPVNTSEVNYRPTQPSI